jgi:hypothetical protein
VSVSLAHHDDRLVVDRGCGDPRLGRRSQAPSGDGDCPGDDRVCGLGGHAAAVEAPIDFLRVEVADICGALALGGSLLRRLGLGPEAARLESLYGAVAARLAEDV